MDGRADFRFSSTFSGLAVDGRADFRFSSTFSGDYLPVPGNSAMRQRHGFVRRILISGNKPQILRFITRNWFNDDSVPKDYIKSAVAHFWFVCIHPFDDGNGRIGRAIADMALSQAGNSTMRYFSMSRQINKEKSKYYDILERSQKGSCDITAWIDWYLDCMIRAIENADKMLTSILNKSVFWQTHSHTALNDRQNKVLNLYLDGYIGKLTVKNWAKLSKVSIDTAERDIKALVGKEILVPQDGKIRNVAYGIQISQDNIYIPGPIEP